MQLGRSSVIRLAVIATAIVTVSASVLKPPVLPLIVRNPYLSAWLSDARDEPWQQWPMFWNGQKLGFSVMAFVHDTGVVYPLLGRPHDSLSGNTRDSISFPKYLGPSYDASTTNLTYRLEAHQKKTPDVEIILSFLSPVTPTSTFRQSLPAAYVAAYVQGSSNVSIYVDVNGDWVTGQHENEITSHLSTHKRLKAWHIARKHEQLFTETDDRPEWGTLSLAGAKTAKHQAGSPKEVRSQFVKHGHLDGAQGTDFKNLGDSQHLFALSQKISPSSNSTTSSNKRPDSVALFTLTLVQDPMVQFASARGLTMMRPLWASYMPSAKDMIDYHYRDFSKASKLAEDYSHQLQKDARASIPGSYYDIVALSARQVMGATQFSGTPDNPILFLKEISSNGNFQTVDVIFPAFPFFLYTNPRWLAYLLEPLLEHQLSLQYPNDYSMHDIGAHYPNATGHPDGNDEYMPVEECGDMIIMALAMANAWDDKSSVAAVSEPEPCIEHEVASRTANEGMQGYFDLEIDECAIDVESKGSRRSAEAKAWLERSYKLWKQWSGYLVRESLIPSNQLCTDDFAGPLANQTNLALKGIIGIKAMSEIAEVVGQTKDSRYYKNISSSYLDTWQDYGLSRDGTHAKLSYTWYGSWTTLYNIFADALLCFHLPESRQVPSALGQRPLRKGNSQVFVPNRVYDMQSKWYGNVVQRYGVPLDSRHLYTKSDWEFFAAAVSSKRTREAMVDAISLWVNETITDRPLTDLYDTEGKGDFSPVRFLARPVVGGHFAPLALARACGGKASEGLSFLDDEEGEYMDVESILAAEVAYNRPGHHRDAALEL